MKTSRDDSRKNLLGLAAILLLLGFVVAWWLRSGDTPATSNSRDSSPGSLASEDSRGGNHAARPFGGPPGTRQNAFRNGVFEPNFVIPPGQPQPGVGPGSKGPGSGQPGLQPGKKDGKEKKNVVKRKRTRRNGGGGGQGTGQGFGRSGGGGGGFVFGSPPGSGGNNSGGGGSGDDEEGEGDDEDGEEDDDDDDGVDDDGEDDDDRQRLGGNMSGGRGGKK